MLTLDYLKTRLLYNKDTGVFTWIYTQKEAHEAYLLKRKELENA